MWNMICFFQAEDCIRDGHVTGVQTCALPILIVHHSKVGLKDRLDHQLGNAFTALQVNGFCWVEIYQRNFDLPTITGINSSRSEERRVGKECRAPIATTDRIDRVYKVWSEGYK